MSNLLNGKNLSQKIFAELATKIQAYRVKGHRAPQLAVLLIGSNEASHIYVSHKEKACKQIGIISVAHRLPESISQEDVCDLVMKLNSDPQVDGILVQLPLPAHLNPLHILDLIASDKDVDGLTAMSQGLLALNRPGLVPCTPLGVMRLLSSINLELEGKIAAVIGRSTLVGGPMARLLMQKNATVIQVHSKTPQPWLLTSQADVVVAAAGVAKLVTPKWIKEGAVVVDVGIHRQADGLCGDVDFARVMPKTSFITPVPGGVGPMTIASLLLNCMTTYEARLGLS